MENIEEIKEIALNPRFLTNDDYKSLKNQGFLVRWMTQKEVDEEDRKIFTFTTK